MLDSPPAEYGQGTESDSGDNGAEPAEKAQTGDDSAGDYYSTENGKNGVFELHAHEESGYRACPGAGKWEWDGDKQRESDPLISLDELSVSPGAFQSPVYEPPANFHFADNFSQRVEEQEQYRYRQHITDDGQRVCPVPGHVEHVYGYRQGAAKLHYGQY